MSTYSLANLNKTRIVIAFGTGESGLVGGAVEVFDGASLTREVRLRY